MSRRSFDRERALDGAIEVFWREGYAASSMATLLDEMGISRQSLYNCFGDKRRLFLEALDRYIEQMSGTMLATLEAPDAGYDAIVQFFAALARKDERTAAKPRGCFIGKTAMELAAEDPEIAERIRSYSERTVRAFRSALTTGMARGEVAPCDCGGVATQLTATVFGLGMLHRAGLPPQQLLAAIETTLASIRPRERRS